MNLARQPLPQGICDELPPREYFSHRADDILRGGLLRHIAGRARSKCADREQLAAVDAHDKHGECRPKFADVLENFDSAPARECSPEDDEIPLLPPHHSDDLAWIRRFAERCVRKDRKSTRLNSSHLVNSYAVFCLKKKKKIIYIFLNKKKKKKNKKIKKQ